jgi:hypothetical protein
MVRTAVAATGGLCYEDGETHNENGEGVNMFIRCCMTMARCGVMSLRVETQAEKNTQRTWRNKELACIFPQVKHDFSQGKPNFPTETDAKTVHQARA